MMERAVFIGSISVWDTIGTLVSRNVEIVRLFRLVSCCVMGRKAPRKRLARRDMACPTGVPPSTQTSLGAPPTPRSGLAKQSYKPPGAKTRRGNEEVLFDEVLFDASSFSWSF